MKEYTMEDWLNDVEVRREVVCLLRKSKTQEVQHIADLIQFDDGGRCNSCKQLAGGDRSHKC